MSKMIKLTDEFKDICLSEFKEALQSTKLADGKLSFMKTFDYEKDARATVYFTSKAWMKMTVLLNEFDKEVAWHGVAKRYGEENEHKFIITDILVYPQEVTSATVNTDQEKYQTWLMSLDDETFNNLRMQGHSHVYMQTSPSGVDLTHQEKILDQLEDDMFYIFMIWNKRYERTIKIYDLKNNILFENKDIDIRGADEEDSIFTFLSDAKKQVTNASAVSYGSSASTNNNSKVIPAKTESTSKPITKAGDSASKSESSYKTWDDDDEDIYGYKSKGRYYGGYYN